MYTTNMPSRHCAVFIVILACTSCSQRPTATSAPADSVKSIADAYWEFVLRESPETATQLGEYKYNDQLSDYSIAHAEAAKQQAASMITRLKSIDPTKLNEADRLDHALLLGNLQDAVRSADLKMYEMPVDQFYGVQIAIPQIATTAPFDTVKHFEDYIGRMHQIPGRFEQLTATMRQGMQDKLMPPKYLLERRSCSAATSLIRRATRIRLPRTGCISRAPFLRTIRSDCMTL